MFYPGSLNFSSRILGVKKHRILLYIKRGMKNKTNLFLASYGLNNNYTKNKGTRILKKISSKTYRTLWIRDLGSEKNSSRIPDPDPQHRL
jgi:hypothetical protein